MSADGNGGTVSHVSKQSHGFFAHRAATFVRAHRTDRPWQRYEGPLQAALEGKGIGEVTGGGSQLDEDVYAELDFEGVVAEIGAAAGEDSYDGFSQGAEETGLYFFGPDAEAMFARVEPVLRRLPIGQNARVVLRSGREGLNPREVRMPRH